MKAGDYDWPVLIQKAQSNQMPKYYTAGEPDAFGTSSNADISVTYGSYHYLLRSL
jgi:hypothetical protein